MFEVKETPADKLLRLGWVETWNAQDMVERGRHRGNRRLTQHEVEDIRRAVTEGVVNYAHIGELYGVTRHQVSLIARNLSWKEN